MYGGVGRAGEKSALTRLEFYYFSYADGYFLVKFSVSIMNSDAEKRPFGA